MQLTFSPKRSMAKALVSILLFSGLACFANGGTYQSVYFHDGYSNIVRYEEYLMGGTYYDSYKYPLPTPDRSGYAFVGWFTSTSGGTQITDASIVSSSPTLHLYAHWGPNTPVASKEFGPGKVSSIVAAGIGNGSIVGASGVSWADFSSTDYYGTKSFVDANIADAEKTAANDADDYWCYQISDMDALFFTGWAGKTPFQTVDDMKESFNGAMIRDGDGERMDEGPYGFRKNTVWGDFLDWYTATTGIDLVGNDIVTEGVVGASFLSSLKGLMDDGGHVLRINVFFKTVHYNAKWKSLGGYVSHGVLCVGYLADGAMLKALFIVDPDNDHYTGSGGRSAPNSVMYCPVSWDAAAQSYTITGVWGQDGVILPEYRAFKVMSADADGVPAYKVAFNANGGTLPKGKKMAAQTLAYDAVAKLTKNAFMAPNGCVFAGWATSKANAKKGVVAYKDAATVGSLTADGGTVTLYAVWAKKTYKVAFYANGGTGRMAVQKFSYGKAKKLSANKFKAPKGKKFIGWAKSKSAAKKGKVTYKNKQKVKNLLITGKTVKLYAVWGKK